ncbi:hypothetical protein [Nocardia sp. NPDC059239]|uniref:hypothetical protein n=1 Tax=unclassified Nocardia TaxID=2637762 RepID=UPI0036A6736C
MAETLVEIELVDRALALAAQIFTSVLPVIIAASAFSGWQPTTDTIRDQFGFDPAVLHAGDAATSSDRSLTAFGVVGLLMIILSGTSFARALGRVYGAVWRVPSMGPRDAWRWLTALLAVALSTALVEQTRDLTRIRVAGQPLALLGEVAVWTLVWAFAPFLLTKGALTGRVLWTTGVLTAIGLTAVHVVARIVLPRITAQAQQHFGPWGLAFTSVSWLFVMSVVIVGAAAIVKAVASDDTAVGHYLRHRAPATGA